MKCTECIKEGKKSTIHLGGCTSTLLYIEPGYYDEDGNWVENNDFMMNTISQEYHCSNGHCWTVASKEQQDGN